MRSILATEVPPNFMTRRAMVVVCAFLGDRAGRIGRTERRVLITARQASCNLTRVAAASA
jgi:hypothetical protein